MRLFIAIVIVVTSGLAVGGALAWYSVQDNHGFGALRIGTWTAWPLAGESDADPYTKAKVATDGQVPLGAAEGIVFFARTDSNGQTLDGVCDYQLSGATPPSRHWTLTAYSQEGPLIADARGNVLQLTSSGVLRTVAGGLTINVSQRVRAGNWLRIHRDGPFFLAMRLYDTPVSGTKGIVDPQLPIITQMGCRS